MLLEMMRECRNFFEVSDETGVFKLESGRVGVKNKYLPGQFVAISGSVMNNGVHRVEGFSDGVISFVAGNAAYPNEHITTDEEFTGTIYALSIPRDFLMLADEIKANIAKTPQSGFTSESFGAYSYSRATNVKGVPVAWSEVYAARLLPYRRMFAEVRL